MEAHVLLLQEVTYAHVRRVSVVIIAKFQQVREKLHLEFCNNIFLNIQISDACSLVCANGGLCTYVNNVQQCTCLPGYTGSTCQTSSNACNSSPCKNNGTCNYDSVSNSYSCACSQGFNGLNCESAILGTCNSNPCMNNGICNYNSQTNSYTCSCSSGFQGTNCETSLCTLNCINNGQCVITNGVQNCQCNI